MKLRALTLIMFAAVCFSCANNKPVQSGDNINKVEPKRRITDDLDRTVILPVKVNRIVSLAPSATEMVYAVGAGDRLVGVTTFCNYPEQALEVAKVGDTMNPNMETIVALKPDVVLVSTASQIENFTKTLEQNGIAVFVMNPTSFFDIYNKSLDQLGTMFDTYDRSSGLSRVLMARHSEIIRITGGSRGMEDGTDRAPDAVRSFVQISREPLFTIGKGSFLNELIKDAGGLSVTENVETSYPKISKETASAFKPEAIILSDSEDNRDPNDVFANSPAVKNKRILKVNADILSRPGPRLIDALEQIAKFLHPEKFK